MDFTGSVQNYQIVHRKSCVIIIPEQEDNFLLVKEFRPSIEDYIIQFPAGKLEPEEQPIRAAKRELLEETGYECEELTNIGSFLTAVHFSDEIMNVFIAKKLSYRGQALTKRETIKVESIACDEIEQLFRDTQSLDAKTIMAYYLWRTWKEERQ